MQYPQLNKYQSLVQKHLRPQNDNMFQYTHQTVQIPQPNLQELLNNIQEINIARSYEAQRMKEIEENTLMVKSNKDSQETLECQLSDNRTFKSENTVRTMKKSNRSLIFPPKKFSKRKESIQPQVQIYFFDLPVTKAISFDSRTKISDLIQYAISAYLSDSSLDASKIKQRHYTNYQLRLLANEEGFKADLSIPAISYDRLVAENMFDTLVFRAKDKSQRASFKAEKVQYINQNQKKNTATITLFNQLEEELGHINMNCSDSLEKIFQHIQTNDLHNMRSYFLTQNKNDLDGLPRDFQVKNLQSNKIYVQFDPIKIKAKKFIDESDWQSKHKPIKALTILARQPQVRIQLPIGLNEASQYQEFAVIKVNSMGFEQERIIGIDQNKIYNYDKGLRQQKKQTGFLSKIFGVNQTTGTKKPFRLIADIIGLKKTEKGLIVEYKEKAIPYIVKNPEARDKIFRKLNFLIHHNQEEKTTRTNSVRS